MKNNCGSQIDQRELFRRAREFTASNGYKLDVISAKEIPLGKLKDPSNLYHEQLAAALDSAAGSVMIEVDTVPEHLRGKESMSLVAEEIARMNRRNSLLAKTKMAAGMTPPETQPAIMKITQYGELQNADGSTEVVSFELVAKP